MLAARGRVSARDDPTSVGIQGLDSAHCLDAAHAVDHGELQDDGVVGPAFALSLFELLQGF